MKKFKPNQNLMGCPLYRKLLPRRMEAAIIEPLVLLIIMGVDFGAIWAIESREIQSDLDIAQNIGMYFLVFCFTMMLILVSVREERKAKQVYQKRGERLQRIPEEAFWALDAEISMSELRYGSFYFLKEYFYAPRERLLIRYQDIAEWHFGDFVSVLSGDLKDQFIDIVEADGLKTQILIRQRRRLLQDHDEVRVRLDYYIMKAKYPKGTPYQK